LLALAEKTLAPRTHRFGSESPGNDQFSPSVASSTPADVSAPASLLGLLSPELQADLATTGLARYVRIEKSKEEYFKQRDQERKAKDAAKRNEKKKSKKNLFWKGKADTRVPNTSSYEDVVMTGPVNDNKPSSSKTPGA